MHICELCNYESTRLSDYKRHLDTKKHVLRSIQINNTNNANIVNKESKIIKTNSHKMQNTENNKKVVHLIKKIEDNTDEIKQFVCLHCGKKYKHNQTLWTHKQKCKKQEGNMEKIMSEFAELKSKIDILATNQTTQTANQLTAIYNTDMSTNYLNNTINNNKIINNQKTINVVAYVNEHYQTTEPLKLLDKPQLSKMLTCDPEKNGNHSICEFIVYYFDNHMLEELLADIIIQEFKKQNEKDQQFFATDVARLTFIVRQALKSHVVGKNTTEKCIWLTDKKGTSIVESIIVPLLSEVHTMLIEHIKEWDTEKNNTHVLSKIEKLGNRILSARKIALNIVKGDYKEKTLQLISPYFQFQTTKAKNTYLITY